VNFWLLIAGCVATTVVIKAAGPVMLGGRDLPPAVIRVVACMAPALLAGLVATAALTEGHRYQIGADTIGMLAGGVLLWRGVNVVWAVLLAVVVTAGLRAIGG
jgi:branched-subunit amino acid transport protein